MEIRNQGVLNLMLKISHIFLLSIFVICVTNVYSQKNDKLTTSSKKAEKAYLKGEDYYRSFNYNQSVFYLLKATDLDPDFIEAWLLLGDLYLETDMRNEAKNAYKNATQINASFFPPVLYILGQLELNDANYEMAKQYLTSYLDYDKISETEKNKTQRFLKTCEFAIEAIANPVSFQPVNLGDSINSPKEEFIDAITVDGQRIYFTVLDVDLNILDAYMPQDEDFYFSEKINGTWHKAVNLGPPVNSSENEGAMFISPDGRYLLFAGCGREGGYGSCDIFISKKIGDKWEQPANLGPMVNTSSWETMPCLSSDGRTLYFVSNRSGGEGRADIWETTYISGEGWSAPENLGKPINTPESEMSPFLHPDNQTLYFSSKGHVGMGGMDLFVSRKDSSGNWSEPVNMGYPVNTIADEKRIIVNATGDTAYISSDKLGGFGNNDIYSFELDEKVRPQLVTYFKGKVYDENSRKLLEAGIDLIDLQTGLVVIESMSDQLTGEFLVCLPSHRNYMLNVRKDGYLFYSDHFELAGENPVGDPFLKDIPLKPIEVGESVILKNIFFETDQYQLKNESKIELNKLVELLNENPEMKIEIGGHTDNTGTEEYNNTLSLNRAKSVYEYLVANEIPSVRLTYKGYGFSQPIAENESDGGRKMNRRTEFKVVGK